MPRLPQEFTALIRELDLPLDDDVVDPLDELSARELGIVARQAVNLLGRGWGAALVALGVDRAEIPAPIDADALLATPGFSDILGGLRSVTVGEPDADLVGAIQSGLQAIAGRIAGAPKPLALPLWGADRFFGGETLAALAALRTWRHYAADPPFEFGRADAEALLGLLRQAPPPELFATPRHGADEQQVQAAHPTERIVEIARAIASATETPYSVTVQGATYSYRARDFGVEPAFTGLLRAPGGVAYSLREGVDFWKCNVFGGTVLSLAEVPVPTHSVGRFRHFPRAERFGEYLARSRGWKLITHLDHRDPANPEAAIVGEAQNEEIRRMLLEIRAGDIFFADNPGPPGQDGGHTRVCVEAAKADDPDNAPLFAQARYASAVIQRDGMARLGNGRQIQFWVLRYVG